MPNYYALIVLAFRKTTLKRSMILLPLLLQISPQWNALALECNSARKILKSIKWEIPIKRCTCLNVELRTTGHFLRYKNNWVMEPSDWPIHKVLFINYFKRVIARKVYEKMIFIMVQPLLIGYSLMMKIQNVYWAYYRFTSEHFTTRKIY